MAFIQFDWTSTIKAKRIYIGVKLGGPQGSSSTFGSFERTASQDLFQEENVFYIALNH